MKKQNMFTGRNPDGYKAEIRQDPDGNFSCFTWFDTDKTGLIMWRQQHDMKWEDAFIRATEWLNTKLFRG